MLHPLAFTKVPYCIADHLPGREAISVIGPEGKSIQIYILLTLRVHMLTIFASSPCNPGLQQGKEGGTDGF